MESSEAQHTEAQSSAHSVSWKNIVLCISCKTSVTDLCCYGSIRDLPLISSGLNFNQHNQERIFELNTAAVHLQVPPTLAHTHTHTLIFMRVDEDV